jgi:hypothetical protein
MACSTTTRRNSPADRKNKPRNVSLSVAPLNVRVLLTGYTTAGTVGCSGPSGSGTYSFWAQDNTAFDEDWTIAFVTLPIPKPSTALLLISLGLVGLSARRRALRA